MNPFSQALFDYHEGNCEAAFIIRRDDGFQQPVPASFFFDSGNFSQLEIKALDECRGHVLDIGCAAGRHSLELIRRGLKVTSLEILPELEVIMKDRGLTDVVVADILTYSGRQYDTLLMLMNGIGMTGDIDGLKRFLRNAHDLILPGGQIVCDSLDVSITTNPQHIAYREKNLASGCPAGCQNFTMDCEGSFSMPFRWLHIDFPSLACVCEALDWEATLLDREDDGHYLCRLTERYASLTR